VTVALRVPKAVICLVSALSHHSATTQIPRDVHIALPRGTKKPQLDYPPIQVLQLTGDALTMGVDVVEIDGVPVRIYNLAKTVVDCFRFRNSIGTDVAIEALKEAVQRRGISPAELLKYARACKLESIMIPYLEAV
jgi:predicted transcriptional regulator of viral defense system